MPDDPIASLREALHLSPDNVPLRLHVAESLLSAGRFQEAETEFRQALSRAPGDARIQIGLARAYEGMDKPSHALAILETLLKAEAPPPRARLLYARLALRAGEVEAAVRNYRKAVEADASLADRGLAERLGIGAGESSEVSEGRLRAAAGDPEEGPAVDAPERPKVTFRDVGGMEAVKDEIRMKIIHPLSHPELYKAYGKPAGGGILMFGPPGCGKTHLARATAGEIRADFIAVGIHEVLDMWIGASERNLNALFAQARDHRPCVLFFDEVDALGSNRSDLRQSAGRHLINQFLAEMDGLQSDNEGLLVLAATNAPWHLDPAFRRPGRFDRILFVPPPDAPARASILRILVEGKPQQGLDFEAVAKKTEGFSGADLKGVVGRAIEQKLRQAFTSGIPEPLTTRDLLAAASSSKPTVKEWFATARNYALYANQGGAYDDVLAHLKL